MVQETSFGNDRDQKTKRTATITKGTRGNVSHKVRRQSVSQERGFRSTKGPHQLTSRSRSKEMVTRGMKVHEPLSLEIPNQSETNNKCLPLSPLTQGIGWSQWKLLVEETLFTYSGSNDISVWADWACQMLQNYQSSICFSSLTAPTNMY